MNLPARGRAAGKVILLGEHAVVYGRPALAAGLALGLEVEVRSEKGPARVESDRPGMEADSRPLHLVKEAAAALHVAPRDLVVSIRSELPPGAGLGSSAALSVAVLRALATEGIQKGHMALHARAVSHAAGARGEEAEELRRRLLAAGEVKIGRARELLRALDPRS